MRDYSAPQIPLDLSPNPDFSLVSFEVGDCNRAAYAAVTAWPNWPAPILLLSGPKGSGKTHLGQAWAKANDAAIMSGDANIDLETISQQPVFLDAANRADEAQIFGLLNFALSGQVPGLLLAARQVPQLWDIALPDLRSRLVNVPAASLEDADDTILEAIIRKLFEDQGRMVKADVVVYLIKHEVRSIPALRRVVTELEQAARQAKRDVTRSFTASFLKARRAET